MKHVEVLDLLRLQSILVQVQGMLACEANNQGSSVIDHEQMQNESFLRVPLQECIVLIHMQRARAMHMHHLQPPSVHRLVRFPMVTLRLVFSPLFM